MCSPSEYECSFRDKDGAYGLVYECTLSEYTEARHGTGHLTVIGFSLCVRTQVENWRTHIVREFFENPILEGDPPQPKRMNGKSLVDTVEHWNQIVDLALARILNCIPPPDIQSWVRTGKLDKNDLPTYKSMLGIYTRTHSCTHVHS